MKNIKILTRRSILESKAKRLKKEQEELEKQFHKLTECCNHEIIIEMEVEGDWRDCRRGYCLFCQEINPWFRKYVSEELQKKIDNSTTIDAEQYPLVLQKSLERRLGKLEKLYKQLKKKFTKDSESQIAEKMKQKLEEENEKKYKKLRKEK